MEQQGLSARIWIIIAAALSILCMRRRRKRKKMEREEAARLAREAEERRKREEEQRRREKRWKKGRRWIKNPVVRFFILMGMERLISKRRAETEQQLAERRFARRLVRPKTDAEMPESEGA